MLASNATLHDTEQNTPSTKTLWFFFILIFLIEFGVYFFKHTEPYLFIDTDAFMRMVRVETLVSDGNWYNQAIARSNFPFGEELHWSRALDILIIVLSFPFRLFYDPHAALALSGVIISPVLKMLSLTAFFWAAQAIFCTKNAFRACILLLAQLGLVQYFSFARPDHHSLLLLTYILFLGAALRAIDFPSGPAPFWAGILSGIGLWTSPETLVPIASFLLFQFVHWLYNEQTNPVGLIKYQATLLACSAVAILIERPPAFFTTIVYDKLSFVHFIIFALFLLQLLCLNCRLRCHVSRNKRWVYALLASMVTVMIINYMFPAFFKGPFVAVDKQAVRLWLSQVNEVQPLRFSSLNEINTTVAFMGSLFFSCIILFKQIFTHTLVSNPKKQFLLLSLLLFSLLAFYQARWTPYAEIMIVLYNTVLLSWCLNKVQTFKRFFFIVGGQVAVWTLIALGHLLCVLLLSHFISISSPPALNEAALHTINQTLTAEKKPMTILTHIDYGPQILYETNHNVIATPYHRNTAGMLFWFDTMASTDMETVKSNLLARNVTHILIDPQRGESFLITDQNNFFEKLLNNTALPPWIEPIALPANQASSWLLYKVTIKEP